MIPRDDSILQEFVSDLQRMRDDQQVTRQYSRNQAQAIPLVQETIKYMAVLSANKQQVTYETVTMIKVTRTEKSRDKLKI